MPARRQILAALPLVLGYSAVEAAAAIGVSATKFRELVEHGTMPRPRLIGRRQVWDVDELRACFKALPREDETGDDEIEFVV